ncbi:hypothetical protein BC831DRAFT_403903, partial [Entophlyctis helioformis]
MSSIKSQTSYAHSMPVPKSDHNCYEGFINGAGVCFGAIGYLPCCPCFNSFQTVQQGTVGMLSRFGKYYRSVDPGLYFVNMCSEHMRKVDIKIQIEDVPRQQVMTKDNVSIYIDSVLYWHVVDPYAASYLVQDVRRALIERTMTTLRQTIGTRTLQDSIENRETIA